MALHGPSKPLLPGAPGPDSERMTTHVLAGEGHDAGRQGPASQDAASQVVDAWAVLLGQTFDHSLSVARGLRPPGVHVLGHGVEQIHTALDAIEPKVRYDLRALQPETPFDAFDRCGPMNQRARSRGVRLTLITSRQAGRSNPFVHSARNQARCGPAVGPMLLLDRHGVVLPGLPTLDGEPTAILYARSDVVRQAFDVWDLTLAASVSAEAAGWPATTGRQHAIACRLLQGLKDSSIARELGISTRTLTDEVRGLLRLTGAASRCEIGARLGGGLGRTWFAIGSG